MEAFAMSLAMSDGLRVTLQVIASIALVVAVLWAMWRIPRRGERGFAFAPPLALFSAWLGLAAVALSIALWFVAAADVWIALVMLVINPGALTAGILVQWIYRGYQTDEPTVAAQRLQGRVGIVLGSIGVVLSYVFVMTHRMPFT